jgi:hypothetical protein
MLTSFFRALKIYSDPGEVETSKWPPNPGVVETFKWPSDPSMVGAVTAEVTEGQWPKISADMEKCARPVTKFKKFNFFVPLTEASKPPSAAALNRIDLNDANAYFEDPRLFGPVVVESSKWRSAVDSPAEEPAAKRPASVLASCASALGRKSFGQNLPSGCDIHEPTPPAGGS